MHNQFVYLNNLDITVSMLYIVRIRLLFLVLRKSFIIWCAVMCDPTGDFLIILMFRRGVSHNQNKAISKLRLISLIIKVHRDISTRCCAEWLLMNFFSLDHWNLLMNFRDGVGIINPWRPRVLAPVVVANFALPKVQVPAAQHVFCSPFRHSVIWLNNQGLRQFKKYLFIALLEFIWYPMILK